MTPDAGTPSAPDSASETRVRVPAVFSGARTIDDVIQRLDVEIERAVQNGSRLAFFACLYRLVTRRVRDGIAAGRFADGPRMERFDVIFANRYLEALAAHHASRPTTQSWTRAFEAADSDRLVILQHLLLGMNAHIGLDLGIAASETAPGAALPALQGDFNEINRLLGEMLDEVQARLARVSPWMGLLDHVGGRSDERICSFCLRESRDLSWCSAERLVATPASRIAREIDGIDCAVALLARPIERPDPIVRAALLLVRAREADDVATVVDALG